MSLRDDFLTVADSASVLLRDPLVAARWDRPSALADFSVGGLAAHLAAQILHVPQALPSTNPPISIMENYARAIWVGTDAAAEVNVSTRRRAELSASAGVTDLLASVEQALVVARSLIAGAPDDLVVHLIWTGWELTFDDFLLTRLLELVVHSDDLAVSVGLETPPIPESAALSVVTLLAALSVRRHGVTPVVRALSRAERAPRSISAL